MKNIIFAILTSMMLFAASAGTSIYLNQAAEPTEDAMDDTTKKSDDPFEERLIEDMVAQMPVAVRPDQALTIEAVRQMSEAAEKRRDQLDLFESQLKKEEQRVQLLFADLKREKQELTSFSLGVESKVEALDAMTVRLQDLVNQYESQKKELEALAKKTGTSSSSTNELEQRVNLFKDWFDGMEAQQAADILVSRANQGEIGFAAALLNEIPDRQKTKILAAIDDETMINQLLDSLKVKTKVNKEN